MDHHIYRIMYSLLYFVYKCRRVVYFRKICTGDCVTSLYRFIVIALRVLNAAARVVSNTRKFGRGLSQLLHDGLHWLDVPGRLCVQADSHCSSVSERPCTELSVEQCHPSQRYRVTAAPSVCSTEHTCGPTLQTDHIRPSSISCCGSHSVEQSSCRIQRPDNQRCLLPTAFNSVGTIVFSACEICL